MIDISKPLTGSTFSRYESGAIMVMTGHVLKYNIPIEKGGMYNVEIKIRTGQATNNNDLVNGYKFNLNGKDQIFTVSSIGQQEKRFGLSFWGIATIKDVRLEAGNNTLTITLSRDYTGVESINFVAIKLDAAPAPIDYQKMFEEQRRLYLEQKTIADTAKVNLSAANTTISNLKEDLVKALSMFPNTREKTKLDIDILYDVKAKYL